MADADIDKIILKHWPIEAAMAGQKPTFDTLRAMVREAVNAKMEKAMETLRERSVSQAHAAGGPTSVSVTYDAARQVIASLKEVHHG